MDCLDNIGPLFSGALGFLYNEITFSYLRAKSKCSIAKR